MQRSRVLNALSKWWCERKRYLADKARLPVVKSDATLACGACGTVNSKYDLDMLGVNPHKSHSNGQSQSVKVSVPVAKAEANDATASTTACAIETVDRDLLRKFRAALETKLKDLQILIITKSTRHWLCLEKQTRDS